MICSPPRRSNVCGEVVHVKLYILAQFLIIVPLFDAREGLRESARVIHICFGWWVAVVVVLMIGLQGFACNPAIVKP